MEVTCFVKKEGNQYASLCVELDVASCGRTKKDALDGLKRAVETYLEYMVSEGREKKIYRPVPMNELKTLKRRSKEDVFAGYYGGENRVVIVPRNKRSIPKDTLSSIWRQAGISKEIAENIWTKRQI
jgi:predicted RNase H-like HicB family nuclease